MKPLTILLAILLGSLLLFTGCDSDKSGKSSGGSGIFEGTANAAAPSGGGACALATVEWVQDPGETLPGEVIEGSLVYTLECSSSSEWACLQAEADAAQARWASAQGARREHLNWFNLSCDQLCDQAKSEAADDVIIECGD